MSWFVIERNTLKFFNSSNSLDAIERNLNDLDNDFEYLF